MSSGVPVNADAIEKFNNMKTKHDCLALFCEIENNELVLKNRILKSDNPAGLDVSEKGFSDYEALHDALIEPLSPDTPCIAIIEFRFTDSNNMDQSKLCFLKWIPDSCGPKDRMKYASSVEGFKGSFQGFSKEVQANEMADLSYNAILSLFK